GGSGPHPAARWPCPPPIERACPAAYPLLMPMVAGSTGFGPFAPPRLGGPMIARPPSVRRLLVLLVLGTILVIPATAGASTFPDTIRLPDGWQPAGIAGRRGN